MLIECLAIRRGLDNPRDTAATLSTLSTLHLQQDDLAKAREYEEEAIAIFRGLDDRLGEAIGLINLGEIEVRQGDDDGARACSSSACRSRAASRTSSWKASASAISASWRCGRNDLTAAHARFSRALKICRDAQDKRGEAITRWRLAKADAARGDHEAACKG